MSASATKDTEREEFARALTRFARALCAGEDTRRRAGAAGLAMNEALNEALEAARWTHEPPAARTAAYRALVRCFLRECAARAPAPAGYAARQGGANLRACVPASRPLPSTDSRRAADALGRLEPVERAALLLVVVERFSYREAADAIGLTDDEFTAALARAREAFAALLAASGAGGRPHLRIVG